MRDLISVVVPCHNEERNVDPFFQRILALRDKHADLDLELIMVNDGSRDNTIEKIRGVCRNHEWVTAIDFTRNFGKEAALSAGLQHSRGNAVVFIDADLQHPPELISDFIKAWRAGNKVVLARRLSRETDGKLYRFFASVFYRLHNSISDVKLPENVGDFRLIDRQVADQILLLNENRRFMKGLFAWVGHNPVYVDYNVAPRREGTSSFNKWRSWNFALEGITSFSTAPLRIWTYVGAAILILGVLYSLAIIVQTIIGGVTTPGYVTLLTAIVVFSGAQLIGIGILGEYIGRIYLETKHRSLYLIKEAINLDPARVPSTNLQPIPAKDDSSSKQY